ncbi:MAG: ral nucleoside transport system ATP-binding protein [Thermotogota bacterium]|nr:ral nucleoside transport system ATP-binding protein [Thermotogota bacterium]MDK2863834.1 ral nucleoside transport system ATP-binding protein [Thermotogota bacterium]
MALLELRNITKRFPGVLANDNVNLSVESGEVHALLGENGAGKTTLMKILFGIYRMDSGEIIFKGKPVSIRSPKHALELGIGMVQQHFTLVPSFSAVENVLLGLKEMGIIPQAQEVREKLLRLSRIYGLEIDPDEKVWKMTVGEKQRLEILKLLYSGAEVLILDEPTAVLTPQETRSLFKAIEQMKERGAAVIFISHKLNEVMEIADRVTVLRRGKVVGTVKKEDTSTRELAAMMVGREVIFQFEKKKVEIGPPILRIEGLKVRGDKGYLTVKSLDLEVRAGEILGVAGVAGNGQKELAESIYGLRPVEEGKILFDGNDITSWPIPKRINAGIAYIPQDRKEVAVAQNLSVAENLVMKDCCAGKLGRMKLDRRRIDLTVVRLIEEFNIKTPSPAIRSRYLSGGNIQKLILARELSRSPKLIIAEHPTRGLDVGAMEYVYTRLLEEKERGAAVLLLAGDLDEIFTISDRVAVIYDGKIVGYANPDESELERIGLLMAGVTDVQESA